MMDKNVWKIYSTKISEFYTNQKEVFTNRFNRYIHNIVCSQHDKKLYEVLNSDIQLTF